jgi:hypothetical protein
VPSQTILDALMGHFSKRPPGKSELEPPLPLEFQGAYEVVSRPHGRVQDRRRKSQGRRGEAMTARNGNVRVTLRAIGYFGALIIRVVVTHDSCAASNSWPVSALPVGLIPGTPRGWAVIGVAMCD